MGLGFQRGRKYDMDLDRLGRMETSHSELRKTGELNMQKELKKMKKSMHTYSVKRLSQKNYGIGDIATSVGNGVRDVAGTALETGGKLLDNGLAKGAGFVAGLGSMGTGASIGSTIGSVLGPVGSIAGGALGALATPFLTSKAVGVAGKTLKNVGQDIKS